MPKCCYTEGKIMKKLLKKLENTEYFELDGERLDLETIKTILKVMINIAT